MASEQTEKIIDRRSIHIHMLGRLLPAYMQPQRPLIHNHSLVKINGLYGYMDHFRIFNQSVLIMVGSDLPTPADPQPMLSVKRWRFQTETKCLNSRSLWWNLCLDRQTDILSEAPELESSHLFFSVNKHASFKKKSKVSINENVRLYENQKNHNCSSCFMLCDCV